MTRAYIVVIPEGALKNTIIGNIKGLAGRIKKCIITKNKSNDYKHLLAKDIKKAFRRRFCNAVEYCKKIAIGKERFIKKNYY